MASETATFATIALADQYSGSLLDTDLNGVWDLTSGSNTWQFTESTGVPQPRGHTRTPRRFARWSRHAHALPSPPS